MGLVRGLLALDFICKKARSRFRFLLGCWAQRCCHFVLTLLTRWLLAPELTAVIPGTKTHLFLFHPLLPQNIYLDERMKKW